VNYRARKGVKLGVLCVFVALLAILLSQGGGYAGPLQQADSKNPLPETTENLALGLDHFDAHCASCHGSSGKADTGKGKAVHAADLTSQSTQSMSDAKLFRIISRGIPHTAMPAFGKTHSADDIWRIVLFVKKLPTLTPEDRQNLKDAIPPNARHQHHEHSAEQSPQPQQQGADAPHGDSQAGSDENPSAPSADHDMSKMDMSGAGKNDQPAPEVQSGAAGSGASQDSDGQSQHAGHDMNDMSQMGHDMSQMDHGGHAGMMMPLNGGPFMSMAAVGSGTSLMPASSPMNMWHWMPGDWMLMVHGSVKTGFDSQGGPRGVDKAESQNWFMLMADHPVEDGGLFTFRGMFSAEPWTAPNGGFPELFQTGETFRGRPIIDAQHPHNLFMELAASLTMPLAEHVSIFIYGGPVGEPALGPVAFMHRASGSEDPAAPLGHHWEDSTHISEGVFTTGVTAWLFRAEGSIFRGEEPDEHRLDIETGKLDSYSGRIWFLPTPNWAIQFSKGHLHHPELLEPGNVDRTTASATYNRPWHDGNWATTLLWGRNHELTGNSNAYLFESTVNFLDKNYAYTRLELVDKPGLLLENTWGRPGLDAADLSETGPDSSVNLQNQAFRIGAFTFGGVRDVVTDPKLRVGVGADVTFYEIPDPLKPIYGSSPLSFHVFLRFTPGKMEH
jgi:mono/diheme cytochrome c family protein